MLEFLLNKVAGFPACNLLKRYSNTGILNIAKFLRTPILKNICEWLFLKLYEYAHQQAEKSILQLNNYVHQEAAGLSWIFWFSVSPVSKSHNSNTSYFRKTFNFLVFYTEILLTIIFQETGNSS